jgi:hypothetical protein
MSALLAASLAALLFSGAVQAQFEAAVVSPSGIGPPGALPRAPAGREDTRASTPQQIDFSAPAQFDFSESAAPPQAPPDPDERSPARRTPASVDRRADHPGADNASTFSAAAAARRRPTKRRAEDEDASLLFGLPE